jgi:hypothetical protein
VDDEVVVEAGAGEKSKRSALVVALDCVVGTGGAGDENKSPNPPVLIL